MFLQALASALEGLVGHFNPLVAGVLLVLGVVLLRPSQKTAARPSTTVRRTPRSVVPLVDDQEEAPVRQRAVMGARRPTTPPPSSARRRPPRGGGGLFLLLVGGLAAAP